MGHQPARSLPREGTLMRRTADRSARPGAPGPPGARRGRRGGRARPGGRRLGDVRMAIGGQGRRPGARAQPGAERSGRAGRSTARPSSPRPIFVTYSVVRGDAKSYVLQIVTRPTADGNAPLGHPGHGGPRVGQGPEERHPGQEGRDPHPGERAPAASPGGRPGRAGGGHRAGRPLHRRQGAPPERHRVGVRSGAGRSAS